MRTAFLVPALLFTLLCIGGTVLAQFSPAHDIIPRPVSLTPQPGAFTVTAKTAILYPAGSGERKDLAQYLSARLAESAALVQGRREIARDTHPGRSSAKKIEDQNYS